MLKWTRVPQAVMGLALLVMLLSAPGGSAGAASSWQTETVGSGSTNPNATSIALDSAGHPHISYKGSGSGGLMYARHNGTAWDIESVDSGASIGEYSSLDLSDDDLPRISYFDRASETLKYAAYDGTDWMIETVDDDKVGFFTSLAIDAAGHSHISYYDTGEADLKYAYFDGSTWQIEVVDSGGLVGTYGSLALDSAGRPHISYYDRSNQDLKYARYDGTDWAITTVDSSGNIGIHTSLALDSSDNPRISYTGDSADELRYASFNGLSWNIETVDSDGDVGGFSSLALDSAGRPHISYFDLPNDDLKYAHYDGAAWQTEVADSDGDVGRFTSLALDDADQPHISHYDPTNDVIKYTRKVTNQPPAVDASGPYSDGEGSPIDLNGTVTDPDEDTLTTAWSYAVTAADPGAECAFGDALQVNTTFTCTDDGTFTVTLTGDDGIHPAVTDTVTVTIANVAPAITDATATVSRNQVLLSVTASDPGADDVLSYAFDCNNDETYEVDAGMANSATCPFNAQYEGALNFGIQVSDDDGGTITTTVTATIATDLCANNYTGVLRYADSCRGHETALTIPDLNGPVTVCASIHNGMLRAPVNGVCAGHEISYELPEDGPLNVCVSTLTQTMRIVNNLSQCAGHEFGRVIAATEVGETPPSTR